MRAYVLRTLFKVFGWTWITGLKQLPPNSKLIVCLRRDRVEGRDVNSRLLTTVVGLEILWLFCELRLDFLNISDSRIAGRGLLCRYRPNFASRWISPPSIWLFLRWSKCTAVIRCWLMCLCNVMTKCALWFFSYLPRLKKKTAVCVSAFLFESFWFLDAYNGRMHGLW